jgi:hypothetical protein
MDSLAESLNQTGVPAISINLGSVMSVGWLADNEDSKLSGALSHLTVTEDELFSLIEYHIDPHWKAASSIETCHTVAGLRTAAYFTQKRVPLPEFFEYPLFTHLRAASSDPEDSVASQGASLPIAKQLQTAETDPESVTEIVSRAIANKLSALMSIPVEVIEYTQPITSYGVDSLVTMDFRGWIARELAAKVSTVDIVDGSSIANLSRKVQGATKLIPHRV